MKVKPGSVWYMNGFEEYIIVLEFVVKTKRYKVANVRNLDFQQTMPEEFFDNCKKVMGFI
jgi:hypothetical protein